MTVTPMELIGAWRLDRLVHDRRTGQRHVVEGTTILEAEGPGRIVWSERGTMRLPTGTAPVARRLDIARDDRGRWTVLFADGRPFHPWHPTVSLVHQCGSDVYTGRVEIGRTPADTVRRWSMTWDAVGPAKDYRIESVMTRSAGAAS